MTFKLKYIKKNVVLSFSVRSGFVISFPSPDCTPEIP